jgi:hypothetical protein
MDRTTIFKNAAIRLCLTTVSLQLFLASAVSAPLPALPNPAAPLVQKAGWVCLPVGCWQRPMPLPNWVPRTYCDPCYVNGRAYWGPTSFYSYPPPSWLGWGW